MVAKFEILLFFMVTTVVGVTYCAITPGQYSQWRVKLPFSVGQPLPKCLPKCSERCGPTHLGVSVCSSIVEFTDEPPSTTTVAPTPPIQLYVHCFCQKSTIKEREPSKYCGPHGELCQNTQEGDEPPPNGIWLDGRNTMITGIQGVKHVENWNALTVPPAQ